MIDLSPLPGERVARVASLVRGFFPPSLASARLTSTSSGLERSKPPAPAFDYILAFSSSSAQSIQPGELGIFHDGPCTGGSGKVSPVVALNHLAL